MSSFAQADGPRSTLPSTLSYVEQMRDPGTGTGTGFRVYGGGFGHGVGLSRTGAVGMAAKGFTHDRILKHYYQGIDLTNLY